jgi:hypothetical protein
LGREHAPDRLQERVTVEQLEVARQLLDAVDVAPPLDLDGDRDSLGVLGQYVDRADRRPVLPSNQGPALAERLDVLGEQFLQVSLDAIPSSCSESCSTSSIVMVSSSPVLVWVTVQVPTPSSSVFTVVRQGGLIQFNGL